MPNANPRYAFLYLDVLLQVCHEIQVAVLFRHKMSIWFVVETGFCSSETQSGIPVPHSLTTWDNRSTLSSIYQTLGTHGRNEIGFLFELLELFTGKLFVPEKVDL